MVNIVRSQEAIPTIFTIPAIGLLIATTYWTHHTRVVSCIARSRPDTTQVRGLDTDLWDL